MASGDTLIVFTAQAGIPPSTNYATLDTRGNTGSVLVLDFDASTDESIIFAGVLPRSYTGGGITVTVHGCCTSATSGSVRIETAFERSNTDTDTDSFATANSGALTASGTAGIITSVSIAHTSGSQMDSLAAGEPFRLKVTRDANGTTGTDDAAGDFELFAVEVKET